MKKRPKHVSLAIIAGGMSRSAIKDLTLYALAQATTLTDIFLCETAHDIMEKPGVAIMRKHLATALPIDEIREYCAEQPIKSLAVFGSALRGELRDESDIDLLVEYEPDARIGYFELAQHEIDLGELIGRQVDLRTAGELNRLFRQDVIDSARQLYARRKS